MRKFWTNYNVRIKNNNKNNANLDKTADRESIICTKDGASEARQKAGVPAQILSNPGIGESHDQLRLESQVVRRV